MTSGLDKALFQSPQRYNDVPLMTGTNRYEAKLFLAQDPEFVKSRFGLSYEIGKCGK
jgi:hypothetical protein